jgi:hypothetical protein
VYAPSFRLKSFETISDAKKFGVLQFLLEALTMADVAFLLDNPGTADLYASGVRYAQEPDGRDEWQDIPDTLARRNGDCEDLACWRVAELRVRYGEPNATRAITVSTLVDARGQPVTMYHITVLRQNGDQEDPSRKLGMR